MKFSFYSGFGSFLSKYGIEETAKRACDLGFSGVEFCYFLTDKNSLSVETAKEYKKVLDRYGLAVPCFTCATSVVEMKKPDKINEDNVRGICNYLDVAAALGAPVFHHTVCYATVYEKVDAEYESMLELAVKGCKTVARYADKLGIKVIYEPQGFVFNGVEGLGPLLERVKEECPNVGICGDVGNTIFFDEFADGLFEKYPADVLHVHIKDMVIFDSDHDMGDRRHYITRSGKKVIEVPIGTGDIKLNRIFKALKSVGYDGYFSIENFKIDDYENNVRSNMENIEREYNKVFCE